MSGVRKMHLVKSEPKPSQAAQGVLCVGEESGFSVLAGAPETNEVDVYSFKFAPGARNHVHGHRKDQILGSVSGLAIVADAEREQIMESGDLGRTSAGHPHWHSATQYRPFVHLAISVPGDDIDIVDTDHCRVWGALTEGST